MDSMRVRASICTHPKESKKTEIILSTSIAFSISVLFVALRIAGKAVSNRVALTDYVLVAALLLGAVLVGCVLESK